MIGPQELYPPRAGAAAFRLLDVRSPIEVGRGALPGAHNLPLMSDAERHAVGLRYKEAGQEAAIALGYELVGPSLVTRTAAWREWCSQGPTAVACWRGGLRSQLVLDFIGGTEMARVSGGYKAIRSYLISELPTVVARRPLLVLSGFTGAGKTRLLHELVAAQTGRLAAGAKGAEERLDRSAGLDAPASLGRPIPTGSLQFVDLEGLALHRGSAFGAELVPQPSQQTFENALALELLLDPAPGFVVEDESRFIGRRTLPEALLAAMNVAPLVMLDAPLAERAHNVFQEYVLAPAQRLGVKPVLDGLVCNTQRLRKRLGGGRADRVTAALRDAEANWFEPEAHSAWIAELLEVYYDRLYRKVADSRQRPVAFRGTLEEVRGYLSTFVGVESEGRIVGER